MILGDSATNFSEFIRPPSLRGRRKKDIPQQKIKHKETRKQTYTVHNWNNGKKKPNNHLCGKSKEKKNSRENSYRGLSSSKVGSRLEIACSLVDAVATIAHRLLHSLWAPWGLVSFVQCVANGICWCTYRRWILYGRECRELNMEFYLIQWASSGIKILQDGRWSAVLCPVPRMCFLLYCILGANLVVNACGYE